MSKGEPFLPSIEFSFREARMSARAGNRLTQESAAMTLRQQATGPVVPNQSHTYNTLFRVSLGLNTHTTRALAQVCKERDQAFREDQAEAGGALRGMYIAVEGDADFRREKEFSSRLDSSDANPSLRLIRSRRAEIRYQTIRGPGGTWRTCCSRRGPRLCGCQWAFTSWCASSAKKLTVTFLVNSLALSRPAEMDACRAACS